jgi:hypothetical protein
MVEITQDLLKEFLDYNKDTGNIIYRERSLEWFKREPDYRTWNTKFKGKDAGFNSSTIENKVYRKISILDNTYMIHRVIWFYVYGVWPKNNIDHINGNSLDNKLINLRDVTQAENSRNSCFRKNNTSGVNGVSWSSPMKKWRARIKFKGKEYVLGYFESPKDAENILIKERKKLGFHNNHGRTK